MSKQTEIAQLVAEGWEIFTPEIDISRINPWNAGKFIVQLVMSCSIQLDTLLLT